MKFRYISQIAINPLTKERDIIYRPFIPINIGYKDCWLSVVSGGSIKYVDALVDSGADNNLGPMSIAKILNVPLEGITPHQVFGIDGLGIDTFFVPISMEIGGNVFKSFMGFSNEVKEVLLGGQGFFDQWKVKLEYAKDIDITSTSDTALRPFYHS